MGAFRRAARHQRARAWVRHHRSRRARGDGGSTPVVARKACPVTDLDGWIPVGLHWAGARPMVEWRRLEGVRFGDPFFDMTLERAMGSPFRLLFPRWTGIETLEERASTHPGIPPSGFIFHISRCGSTLISQMLAV